MVAVSAAKTNIQASKQAIREYKAPPYTPLHAACQYWQIPRTPKSMPQKRWDCIFGQDMDLNNAIFAGTDNGIIKTTETVFFDLERSKHHLELYNRFQVPDDPMDVDIADDAQALECMKLHATLTISSKQLSQGTGLNAYKKSLQRKKKMPRQQTTLSFNSLHSSNTPDESEESANIHRNCQDAIRSCYHSNNQCKNKCQFELRKTRYLDRIASYERKSSRAKHSIMFIGDRGQGYGSDIKGHLRFGGHWKEKHHDRYTPIIITNEYSSSQACLYCFEKLSYPIYAKATTSR